MKPVLPIASFAVLIFLICSCNSGKQPQVPRKKTVEIIRKDGGFRLYRKGAPYVIKGACVLNARYLAEAKAYGANSVRTYNTTNAGEILDAAGTLGLTVTLGLQLPYAGIEMSYRDDKALARQMEKVRKEVLKYKDHPALLMWGIGNELGLYLKNASVAEYAALVQAIEKMAKMIHEIDPNHPTTTTVPYVRQNTITAINMFCSNLDVISINSFEELDALSARAEKLDKPYVVSEYGANGYWLTAQTDWNTHFEQTSGEKSRFIMEQSKVIRSDTGRCLGSYAFIWAHKLEYTTSWFSLFTPEGEATEVVDALQYTWTGKWPVDRSPVISNITVNNRKSTESIYLKPGEKFTVSITSDHREPGELILTGQLNRDDLEVAELYSQANYKQEKSRNLIPEDLSTRIVRYDAVKEQGVPGKQISLQFEAPDLQGPYRLFIYLHNRKNRVATANVCFYVHE